MCRCAEHHTPVIEFRFNHSSIYHHNYSRLQGPSEFFLLFFYYPCLKTHDYFTPLHMKFSDVLNLHLIRFFCQIIRFTMLKNSPKKPHYEQTESIETPSEAIRKIINHKVKINTLLITILCMAPLSARHCFLDLSSLVFVFFCPWGKLKPISTASRNLIDAFILQQAVIFCLRTTRLNQSRG